MAKTKTSRKFVYTTFLAAMVVLSVGWAPIGGTGTAAGNASIPAGASTGPDVYVAGWGQK